MRRTALLLLLWLAACDCRDGAGAVEVPPLVAAPPTEVVALSVGRDFACALDGAGTVGCWGPGPEARAETVDNLPPAVSISVGGDRACAATREGGVLCWGPPPLGTLSVLPGLDDAFAVSLGDGHACAALRSGRVACWGDNAVGQLGDGTTRFRAEPARVPGLVEIVALSLGAAHSCALRADGTAACWGGYPQLEDFEGTEPGPEGERPEVPLASAPRAVPGLSDAVGVAAGLTVSCARRRDGAVACFRAFLGGTIELQPIPWVTDATALDVGAWGRCVARASGALACWELTAPEGRRVAPSVIGTVDDARLISVGVERACVVSGRDHVACFSAPGGGDLRTVPWPREADNEAEHR